MIRINLLPAELRAPGKTSFGTMLLVIGGTVLVALSVIMLASVTLLWLPSAENEREDKTVLRAQKEKAARGNDLLRAQIAAFEHRRRTINDIFDGRILWAKKLDQLCDLIPEDIWLDKVEVRETKSTAKGKEAEGPTLTLSCHVVGTDESRIADFLRILKEDIAKKEDFFDDFLSIERPGWKAEVFRDFKEQFAFEFTLVLHMKSLESRAAAKKLELSSTKNITSE
jgi:Tfp pilus assembly protein PilN